MKTGTKIAIGTLSALAIAITLYFVFKKKAVVATQDATGTPPAKDIMLEKIKSVMIAPTDSKESKDNFIAILNKMSDSELKDTYFMSIAFKEGKQISGDLKIAMEAISKKYNIFT